MIKKPTTSLTTKLVLTTTLAASLILNACSPAPRRTLNAEDKTADMYWLYSQFNENYAPLEYKESRYGFKYDELKKKYLELATSTKSNQEFYEVMYNFVSEFKDAHTSASLTNSPLKDRAKVAYLGFSGKRVGDTLTVTELLPTIQWGSGYPIHHGDRIVKLDGVVLKDIVLNEMVKFRDLGQEESNLTFHMNRIFNRVSTSNGLPKKADAVITVLRGGKEVEITLPWVVKDLFVFAKEQRAAIGDKTVTLPDGSVTPAAVFQLGWLKLDGKIIPQKLSNLTRFMHNPIDFNFWKTFEFLDNVESWTTKLLTNPEDALIAKAKKSDDSLADLRKQRFVPYNAIPINESKTFPMYITREHYTTADNKDATKFVAYMFLDTFSPENDDETIVGELHAAFGRLREFDVKDIIVDMINNGGGSLSLGMKLAQFFSGQKVVQPEMQFRLSDTWLDEFERGSMVAGSDTEAETNRRILESFKEDQSAGKRLSRKYSGETLLGYSLEANGRFEGKDNRLNMVVLVNEMCASMCDIFTAIMKDNNIAKVVGSKTMGAGGNVVDHWQAPNSHMTVRQTESLVLRKDGGLIENNGIEPDVAVKVSSFTLERYETVKRTAMKLLLNSDANTVEPDTKTLKTEKPLAKN